MFVDQIMPDLVKCENHLQEAAQHHEEVKPVEQRDEVALQLYLHHFHISNPTSLCSGLRGSKIMTSSHQHFPSVFLVEVI